MDAYASFPGSSERNPSEPASVGIYSNLIVSECSIARHGSCESSVVSPGVLTGSRCENQVLGKRSGHRDIEFVVAAINLVIPTLEVLLQNAVEFLLCFRYGCDLVEKSNVV